MKHLLIAVTVMFASCAAVGQVAEDEKKPLDHYVFDKWQGISNHTLSHEGDYVLYELNPQEGDGNLIVRDLSSAADDSLARGERFELSYDSETLVYFIATPYEKEREAKIEGKNPNEEFVDTLGIYSMNSGELEKIAGVDSYKIPEKSGKWLAYHFDRPEDEEEHDNETEEDTNRSAQDEADENGESLTDLVLRNLETGEETVFPHVKDYHFSKHGERLVFQTGKNDSLELAGVHVYDLDEGQQTTISSELADYRSVTLDSTATQVAFLANPDTTEAEENDNDEPVYYNLYYWNDELQEAGIAADTASEAMKEGWMINEWANPSFSEDGSRLLFGTAPEPMQRDTTVEEIDMAEVDVWHWQDEQLQSRQLVLKDQEKRRTYRAVYDIDGDEWIQLADKEMEHITIPDRGNSDYAYGFQNRHYLHLRQWKGSPVFRDVYVVNMETGEREQIMEREKISTTLSPDGNYLMWYDYREKDWFTHHFESGQTTNVTEYIDVAFYDEKYDRPEEPGPYGISGWTEDDEYVVINDRFDLWVVDPDGNSEPRMLTGGDGREHKRGYSLIRLDRSARYFPDDEVYLRAMDDADKSEAFYRTDFTRSDAPDELWRGDYNTYHPNQADDADVVMFRLSTFQDYPDIYISDLDFNNIEKISDANPQQENYLWGDVELFSFTSLDGKELDGLLYTPEDYDPDEQYPTIVYFYERVSDRLHNHRVPAPSASTITPAFYTSRGYVVAMPDIAYKEGYPGKSAENAVNAMTTHLINEGVIDPDRVALQGQSWGGYQIAHIIAHSDMYTAAMAGAPVVNMTSAYGGIRWASGLNRQFQYERTQSRIGKSLWERPMHYLENSPLFYADNVTTPLLMMHNDADGAVPWYQGIEFFTALRRLEQPVWMLNYNDEAHNLRERVNRKDLSRRMQQFFDHYLMDEPMPVWMKYGVPAVEKGKHQGFDLVD